MTNAEKYLKDGVVAKELWKTFQVYYYKNKDEESDVEKAFRNFFEEKTKPQLTEDERVILRNICFTPLKDFYIERNHGTLKLHNRVDELYDFFAYDHLFQFIKERRRILY